MAKRPGASRRSGGKGAACTSPLEDVGGGERNLVGEDETPALDMSQPQGVTDEYAYMYYTVNEASQML